MGEYSSRPKGVEQSSYFGSATGTARGYLQEVSNKEKGTLVKNDRLDPMERMNALAKGWYEADIKNHVLPTIVTRYEQLTKSAASLGTALPAALKENLKEQRGVLRKMLANADAGGSLERFQKLAQQMHGLQAEAVEEVANISRSRPTS